MKKSPLKRILNFLFLVLVFSLTVWAVFGGQDLEQLMEYISQINVLYLIPAVLCVLAFVLGESVIIYYLFRVLGNKVHFSRCCLYSFIGFFYSCITPSASGGQPMQVVAMRKDRIPVAVSSVVLVVVAVTYKLVLVLIGATVMLLRPEKLMMYLDPVAPIIYIGMVLNVICITALLVLLFVPNLVRNLGHVFFRFVNWIRPFKNLQAQEDRLERILGEYQGAAQFFRSHKLVMVNVLILTIVQRVVLFLVTWFTYRAFSLSGESLPVIVSLQAMISVAADMMPLPGGMGVSETIFLEIFPPIFGPELTLPGMVVSRGISFYTQLAICGVMTAVASFVIREKKEKGSDE